MLQNPTNSVWKDNLGRWLVGALFLERNITPDVCTPLYTIHETDIVKDGVIYKSLKRIYMSYLHAPGFEYEFAEDNLGGWEHWNKLCNSALREVFKQWREELTVKQKAQALKKIILQSLEETPTGFQAGKYLVDEGWIKKKGRPKKEQIEAAAKQAAGVKDELADDMERLGLKIVKG